MARPHALPHRRRSIRLTARFNAAEASVIAEAAHASGVSRSDVVRRAVLNLPPIRPVAERQELGRLLAAIGKVGSNVNQIARHANITGELPEARVVAQAAQDIAMMRAALMKALDVDPDDPPNHPAAPAP